MTKEEEIQELKDLCDEINQSGTLKPYFILYVDEEGFICRRSHNGEHHQYRMVDFRYKCEVLTNILAEYYSKLL